MSGLILYTSEDGHSRIQLRVDGQTVWLTQAEMAELFDVTTENIRQHLKNIISDNELEPERTAKESLVVQQEGGREVRRPVTLYNLDAILAVGYRVRSPRGTQFRRWATTVLAEYLVKGFAMDDAKLKDAPQWDYFDEWLERIRDILMEAGFDGPLTIELEGPVVAGLDVPERHAKVCACMDFLRSINLA